MNNAPKIAKLKPEEIEAIRRLEESFGNRFCLLAVEKAESLYVLEAKVAPNVWERIDKVYPQLEGLKPYYSSEEDAKLAKASVKSLLVGKLKGLVEKRPIRIRKL